MPEPIDPRLMFRHRLATTEIVAKQTVPDEPSGPRLPLERHRYGSTHRQNVDLPLIGAPGSCRAESDFGTAAIR